MTQYASAGDKGLRGFHDVYFIAAAKSMKTQTRGHGGIPSRNLLGRVSQQGYPHWGRCEGGMHSSLAID